MFSKLYYKTHLLKPKAKKVRVALAPTTKALRN